MYLQIVKKKKVIFFRKIKRIDKNVKPHVKARKHTSTAIRYVDCKAFDKMEVTLCPLEIKRGYCP
ncbi:hypothetical protein BBO01nite_43390 [Brevibacillus borstelensis]|nr:hypothetical protein BBO01nite_43390 [Brevibacillus borstelensis]